MRTEGWRARAAALRAIPLPEVLRAAGARPDARDPAKWHTALGPLSLTGCKFMNWRSGGGGGGAIDLVMHLQGLDFRATLAWLEERFPGVCARPQPALPVAPFQPPVGDENHLGRVREYLWRQRGLPPEAWEGPLSDGTLYADARANAVFLLCTSDGHAVGAELRGTTQSRWRGLAPGSRKDLGYFATGPLSATAVVLCESAIDALSCHLLHPQARCLSTAGARARPGWLLDLLSAGYQVYCGFDADEAGETQAQAMQAAHPAVRRLRPAAHDWNDAWLARAGH
jgi:hypothetical protein